jgi:NifU-like protein involved in Fe-S cluster formation
MMDDIYNNRILDFAGNIPLTGVLEDADASAEKHSRLCGSKLKDYQKVEGGIVTSFSHE